MTAPPEQCMRTMPVGCMWAVQIPVTIKGSRAMPKAYTDLSAAVEDCSGAFATGLECSIWQVGRSAQLPGPVHLLGVSLQVVSCLQVEHRVPRCLARVRLKLTRWEAHKYRLQLWHLRASAVMISRYWRPDQQFFSCSILLYQACSQEHLVAISLHRSYCSSWRVGQASGQWQMIDAAAASRV